MKEPMTNEALKKHFVDHFALTHHIIDVARRLIRAGYEVELPRLYQELQIDPNAYSPERIAALESDPEIYG